jgi:DNA-binding response OmpR family regulator
VPRLLLIEDDPRIMSGLQALLKKPDRDFLCATSVGEAMRCLVKGAPIDLALIDHHLPDGTGLEVVGELRRLHPGVQVLVMTADPSLDNAVLALERGVNHYVQKPFDAGELRFRVDEALAVQGAALDGAEWARIFDALEQAMVVVDEGGRVKRANRAAQRLAGAGSEAALVGKRTMDLPGAAWGAAAETFEALWRGQTPMREVLDPRSGCTWRITATALKTPTGAPAGTLLTAQDTSEAASLRSAVARLEQRLRDGR